LKTFIVTEFWIVEKLPEASKLAPLQMTYGNFQRRILVAAFFFGPYWNAYTHTMNIRAGDTSLPINDDRNNDGSQLQYAWGPGSFHDGGVHILLCDGAVRFLSENINIPLFRALSTPRGGETIGEF